MTKEYYFLGVKKVLKKDQNGNYIPIIDKNTNNEIGKQYYYFLTFGDKVDNIEDGFGLSATTIFIDEEDFIAFRSCKFFQKINLKLKYDSNKRPYHQGYSFLNSYGSIKDF